MTQTTEAESFPAPPPLPPFHRHQHAVAQTLNNRGAVQVQNGQYEQAIGTFVKALKLSEVSANEAACCCRHCSLNACLAAAVAKATCNSSSSLPSHPLSRERAPAAASDLHTSNNVKRTVEDKEDLMEETVENDATEMMEEEEQVEPMEVVSSIEDDPVESTTNGGGGYVYSHALQVLPHSIHHGHNMGVTLSLIIIFNLALAHHLMGIHSSNSSSVPNDVSNKLLNKALQLYELAYQLHVDEQQVAATYAKVSSRGISSTTAATEEDETNDSKRMGMLRFTMIVSNNLGEIHRVSRNRIKHHMCLQHLLSTIMYMVDGGQLFATAADSTLETGPNTTRTAAERTTTPSMLSQEELDGFLRNASALMRHVICAGAA